jgi:hypothetical protein
MIQPLQSLEITVLVDNGTTACRPIPGSVETEMAGAWRRRARSCADLQTSHTHAAF